MSLVCVECYEPIRNDRDLTRHSVLHRAGTEGLAVEACPECHHPQKNHEDGACGTCDWDAQVGVYAPCQTAVTTGA